MRVQSPAALISVKILAALLAVSISSCSFLEKPFQESCHSHAFTQSILMDYISTRFIPNSPVRVAIVPASVPSNMSSFTNEQPGAGNQLAWRIHQDLLNFGELPIVEVLNRQEWPGKKEEFYTGNFGAIQLAREAGYDFIIVTTVQSPRSSDSLTALTKVIDVASGVTVYYGTSTVDTDRDTLHSIGIPFGITKRDPSLNYANILFDKLGQCISQDIMATKTTPK